MEKTKKKTPYFFLIESTSPLPFLMLSVSSVPRIVFGNQSQMTADNGGGKERSSQPFQRDNPTEQPTLICTKGSTG